MGVLVTRIEDWYGVAIRRATCSDGSMDGIPYCFGPLLEWRTVHRSQQALPAIRSSLLPPRLPPPPDRVGVQFVDEPTRGFNTQMAKTVVASLAIGNPILF